MSDEQLREWAAEASCEFGDDCHIESCQRNTLARQVLALREKLAGAVAREAVAITCGDECCGGAMRGCDDRFHHEAAKIHRDKLRARLAAITGEGMVDA